MHIPRTANELSIEELISIGLAHERFTHTDAENVISTFHNDNLTRSHFRHKLSHELHHMTMTGALTLCTRTEVPCPVHS